jgi:hypothetical protein
MVGRLSQLQSALCAHWVELALDLHPPLPTQQALAFLGMLLGMWGTRGAGFRWRSVPRNNAGCGF